MKKLILLALLLFSFFGSAVAAVCLPKVVTDIRGGVVANPDGVNKDFFAYWFCDDGYVQSTEWRAILGSTVVPSTAYPASKVLAYAAINPTITANDPSIAHIRTAAFAAVAADTPPAAPHWIVTKNGTFTTRPVFLMFNGKTQATKKLATVAANCNCAHRYVTGSSVYCELAGGTIGEVALCNRVMP